MKLKKYLSLILCMFMAFGFCFNNAKANAIAGYAPDNKPLSLKVQYIYGENTLSNVTFNIFKVADFVNSSEFKLSDGFADYNVNINNLDDEELISAANVLYANAVRDGITPDFSGVTNEVGECLFESMPQGLYLITTLLSANEGYVYTAAPYLISLPSRVNEKYEWNYNVITNPKPQRERFNDSSDSDITKSLRVLKVWENNGYDEKQPDNLTVHIYCDNKLYDTVTLNEECGWGHTWENLPLSNNWIIAEEDVAHYYSKGVWVGNTYKLTNSFRQIGYDSDTTDTTDTDVFTDTDSEFFATDSDKHITDTDKQGGNIPYNNDYPDNYYPYRETLPQTGVLWWPVPMMIALGLLLINIGVLIRRRGVKNAGNN